ncbi:MAG: thymidine phosphorylase [Bacillota bacterium]
MRMVDLIGRKREGAAHTAEEIGWIVAGFVKGDIPDYQMSAWMMAVCFSGMNKEETAALALGMARSGDIMDLSDVPGIKVDKHSTGGVGDTTTLVIAPLVAALGAPVAKMSGRGLGHTGGTLDKLESIRGMRVDLSIDEFKANLRKIGVCVTGQTGNLAPADKLMYALRDVTATVRSPALVASSVMSKKIAAGADAIVLDVKCGTGAFMRTPEEARELAGTMADIGAQLKKKIVAVITDMNQPLGLAVGNGLEVREAAQLLRGEIPSTDPLYRVCVLLAAHMIALTGRAKDEQEGVKLAEKALQSGAAYGKFLEMVNLQGGDTGMIENSDLLCATRSTQQVRSDRAGYIQSMDAVKIGVAAQLLGAGREKKTDSIDHSVGLVMHKRCGDAVSAGEPLATLYVNDDRRAEESADTLRHAVRVGEQRIEPPPTVYDVIRQ